MWSGREIAAAQSPHALSGLGTSTVRDSGAFKLETERRGEFIEGVGSRKWFFGFFVPRGWHGEGEEKIEGR